LLRLSGFSPIPVATVCLMTPYQRQILRSLMGIHKEGTYNAPA